MNADFGKIIKLWTRSVDEHVKQEGQNFINKHKVQFHYCLDYF